LLREIDDRTNRFARLFLENEIEVSRAFEKFSVGLAGNNKVLKTFNGQIMAMTAMNLLSRFHPRVNVDINPEIRRAVWMPFGMHSSLVDSLKNMATLVGSNAVSKCLPDLDILISVGTTANSAKYKIVINSDGWLAFMNRGYGETDFVSENQNPIGAHVAACFGVADVFRRLLYLVGSRQRPILREPKPLVFSALDYSIDNPKAQNPLMPQEMDVRAIVVGAGAVANGLIYALSTLPQVRGNVKVVDYQSFEETNINRCLMVCLRHVGINKAEALASSQHSKLNIIPFPTTYEEFRKDNIAADFDLVVSTVDSNDTRIRIQSDLPRILLHGATGEHVSTISRHNFVEGACLGCLFFEQGSSALVTTSTKTGLPMQEVDELLCGDAQVTEEHISVIAKRTGIEVRRLQDYVGRPFTELYTEEICGTMGIKLGDKEFAASVSFVSALPGVLLAGEITKERSQNLSCFRLDNYMTLSLFNPSALWLRQRTKDERCLCMCSHPIMQGAYRQKWCGETK